MPPKTNYFKCVLCSRETKPKERATVNKDIRKFLRKKFLTEANEGDIICNKCRHIYRKEKSTKVFPIVKTVQQNKPQSSNTKSPPSISFKIKSTSKSHAYCCLCKRPGPKLIVISSEARTQAFIEHNILIPSENRCCPNHIINGVLQTEVMKNMQTVDEVFVNRTSIIEILQNLRSVALHNEKSRIDFDSETALTSEDYRNLTGISKDDFNILYTYIKDHVRNTPARSIRTSLGIFLFKLKAGIANKVMATIFNISCSSLRRAISSIRNALMQSFVPENVGFQHISRDDVIKYHTTPLAKTLFGDISESQAILVLDGTYIYIYILTKVGISNFKEGPIAYIKADL